MAGYSGTPLTKKLGIKEDHEIALVAAPLDFDAALAPLRDGVVVRRDMKGKSRFDVIVFFTTERALLDRRFGPLSKRLKPAGALWIAWPKKASGVATDLGDGVVRAVGLDEGLVDNKVCAIDDVWSGLRFVIRVAKRPGAPRR
jgi:hypothetical protein